MRFDQSRRAIERREGDRMTRPTQAQPQRDHGLHVPPRAHRHQRDVSSTHLREIPAVRVGATEPGGVRRLLTSNELRFQGYDSLGPGSLAPPSKGRSLRAQRLAT